METHFSHSKFVLCVYCLAQLPKSSSAPSVCHFEKSPISPLLKNLFLCIVSVSISRHSFVKSWTLKFRLWSFCEEALPSIFFSRSNCFLLYFMYFMLLFCFWIELELNEIEYWMKIGRMYELEMNQHFFVWASIRLRFYFLCKTIKPQYNAHEIVGARIILNFPVLSISLIN